MIPSTLIPQASLIIITYNNLALTRQCLQSIYAKTREPTFEVIVVDNASQDGTVEFLKELAATQPNVQLIFNQTNAGFARANNQGAQAARGEYLIFLNNDTIVTPGWLNGLIQHLQPPEVGMVGPVTNSSGNESRIDVSYQDLSGVDEFAACYTRTHARETFEISVLAFFCVAMRRTVFEQVGPLDERFGLGTFEDDDYAIRIKQMGYKIICAEDVFIHHWGSASFAKLDQREHFMLFMSNRKKFEEKWQTRWTPHLYRPELRPKQIYELVENTLQLSAQVYELSAIYQTRFWWLASKFWTFKASLQQKVRDFFTYR
jgi:GT2 family glycosyltransferase